jgi:hypothetical protein
LLDAQQDAKVYQKLLFHIYIKLNIFWTTYRPSSGAQNCSTASEFAYVKGCWTCGCWTLPASSKHNVQQPLTYAKPEAASAVFEFLMIVGRLMVDG